MMPHFELDPAAADRLLAGHGDAPAGFETVAATLAAARQATRAGAAGGQASPTVAAMVDVVRTSLADPIAPTSAARRLAGRVLRPRVAVAGLVGALSLSGVAAAATGSLPAPAQRAVADVASHVGVDLPEPEAEHKPLTIAPPPTPSTTIVHPDNHGACVSEAAHATTTDGRRGQAVSEAARSDCGKPATPPAPPQSSNRPVNTGNSGSSGDNGNHGANSNRGGNGGSSADHGGSPNSGNGGNGGGATARSDDSGSESSGHSGSSGSGGSGSGDSGSGDSGHSGSGSSGSGSGSGGSSGSGSSGNGGHGQ